MTKRLATLILSVGAWMGLTSEARAQVQIMPTGPLSLKATASQARRAILEGTSDTTTVNPGRTMGGGSRTPRELLPPSYLIRRKE